MAEKLTLSTHWQDEEGWAGKKGATYKPRDSVSFEDPGHALLLRQAGYEANEAEQSAAKK